jgi:Mn-dependent DtxR family transcriptional regulator
MQSFFMDPEKTKRLLKEQTSIEKEILQEIAEALGNAGLRVEETLNKLDELGAAIEERQKKKLNEEDGEELLNMIDRFNELREVAISRFRNLLIHREAVGFRKHDQMAAKYPLPPKKRRSIVPHTS